MKWWSTWNYRREWPVAALVLLVGLFSVMLLFSRKAPIIAGIEPSMAAPGEAVTLTGEYFGRTAREGQLTLGGLTPPPSLIREWSDQRIVFQVPEDAPSGLVTVANTQGVSDSVLFTNTLTIPTVLKTRVVQTALEVTSVVPALPTSGQVVTVSGRGFGRGDAGSWLELSASTAPDEPLKVRLLPVQTRRWSDLQVAFELPGGWGLSTVLVVHTARGTSPAIALQAVGPVSIGTPGEVALDWTFEVTVEKGAGALNVVFPAPNPGLATIWKDAGGDPLRWTNPSAGRLQGVHRITVMTAAKTWNGFSAGQVIPDGLDQPSEGNPGPDPSWKPAQTFLKSLIAKGNLEAADPFVRTRKLFELLRATYRPGSTESFAIPTAADLSVGSSLSPLAAAGVTAVAARQAGLSARIIRGFLIDASIIRPHAWVQIWIAGAAWVDFDPWMLLDPGNADWDKGLGSLDDRHIAWSWGRGAEVRQVAQSRAVRAETPFAGPTLLAETTGDLEITTPLWLVKAR